MKTPINMHGVPQLSAVALVNALARADVRPFDGTDWIAFENEVEGEDGASTVRFTDGDWTVLTTRLGLDWDQDACYTLLDQSGLRIVLRVGVPRPLVVEIEVCTLKAGGDYAG